MRTCGKRARAKALVNVCEDGLIMVDDDEDEVPPRRRRRLMHGNNNASHIIIQSALLLRLNGDCLAECLQFLENYELLDGVGKACRRLRAEAHDAISFRLWQVHLRREKYKGMVWNEDACWVVEDDDFGFCADDEALVMMGKGREDDTRFCVDTYWVEEEWTDTRDIVGEWYRRWWEEAFENYRATRYWGVAEGDALSALNRKNTRVACQMLEKLDRWFCGLQRRCLTKYCRPFAKGVYFEEEDYDPGHIQCELSRKIHCDVSQRRWKIVWDWGVQEGEGGPRYSFGGWNVLSSRYI